MSTKNICIKGDNVIVTTPKREFIFPKLKFTDKELESIENRKFCGGCRNLPSNGFNKNKKNWCYFSRKIAVLQENYQI